MKMHVLITKFVSSSSLPYSEKFLRVQTFATMPPETAERIFRSSYFCNKALHSAVPTGLLKLLTVFIFAVVGLSAKTVKVCTM